MALELQTEIGNTGLEAAYWKVTRISMYDTVHIDVEIYKDKASRDAGKSPICSPAFLVECDGSTQWFSEDRLKQVGNSPKVEAYNYLKSLQEFATAVDI